MPHITCLPDDRTLPVLEGKTILAATLGAGIPHAHACGGQGKCSTCRVWILEGLEHCRERPEPEQVLARRLG
jgi:adenylate cyclase